MRYIKYLVVGMSMMLVLFATSAYASESKPAKPEHVNTVPERSLRLCQDGAAKYSPDVPWWVVCGIIRVETNHGRMNLPGVNSGVNSYGCCAGWGQFNLWLVGTKTLAPGKLRADERPASTWGKFGLDVNRDGWRNVWDPEDAVPSTAFYLQYWSQNSNGGDSCSTETPLHLRRAIFGYNNACWYVRDVMIYARGYKATYKGGMANESRSDKPSAYLALSLGPKPAQSDESGGLDLEIDGETVIMVILVIIGVVLLRRPSIRSF